MPAKTFLGVPLSVRRRVEMRILETAALQQERVLREPAPNAALSAFGVDGLEFTVGYWMGDPQNGQLNLRSQVNVAILKALRENGIRIPPPQRAAAPVTAPVEAAPTGLQGRVFIIGRLSRKQAVNQSMELQ